MTNSVDPDLDSHCLQDNSSLQYVFNVPVSNVQVSDFEYCLSEKNNSELTNNFIKWANNLSLAIFSKLLKFLILVLTRALSYYFFKWLRSLD